MDNAKTVQQAKGLLCCNMIGATCSADACMAWRFTAPPTLSKITTYSLFTIARLLNEPVPENMGVGAHLAKLKELSERPEFLDHCRSRLAPGWRLDETAAAPNGIGVDDEELNVYCRLVRDEDPCAKGVCGLVRRP